MSDLLDEAAAALCEETVRIGDGGTTFARIERTLAAERVVDEAAQLVDAAFESPTWSRIERSLELRKMRHRHGWALAAAAVLALMGSGLCGAWTREDGGTPAPRRNDRPTERVLALETATEAAKPPVPAEPAPVAPLETQPAPTVIRAPIRHARAPRREVVAADDEAREERLFTIAQRTGNRASALPAWEEYLAAYPTGRYAPEARYQRALTLVRIGRHSEARAALAPYSRGANGGSREDEAPSLIDERTDRTQ